MWNNVTSGGTPTERLFIHFLVEKVKVWNNTLILANKLIEEYKKEKMTLKVNSKRVCIFFFLPATFWKMLWIIGPRQKSGNQLRHLSQCSRGAARSLCFTVKDKIWEKRRQPDWLFSKIYFLKKIGSVKISVLFAILAIPCFIGNLCIQFSKTKSDPTK